MGLLEERCMLGPGAGFVLVDVGLCLVEELVSRVVFCHLKLKHSFVYERGL